MQHMPGYECMSASKLLRALGGDRELLAEIIDLFERDAPAMLSAVRRCASAGNAEELVKAAHVLKGSVANFGRSPLYEVAKEIESCAFGNDLTEIPTLMARFETIAADFMLALAQVRREVAS